MPAEKEILHLQPYILTRERRREEDIESMFTRDLSPAKHDHTRLRACSRARSHATKLADPQSIIILSSTGHSQMGLCTQCGQLSTDREISHGLESLTLQSSACANQAARDHLSSLISEIAVLSAHLKQLWAERDIIQAQLDVVTYPVLTLPTEITTEIFLLCLPQRAQEPRRRAAPLLLGGICRDWRGIALSTPRLWSVLQLTLDKSRPRPELLSELLSAWLSRSGAQPLKLSLSYEDRRHEPSPGIISDLILRHAHSLVGRGARSPFEGSFPLLKKLEVCESEFGIRAPPCSFRSLRASSELREFVIDGDILGPMPGQFSWRGLTRFHGYGLTIAQGCEVLHHARLLEECTLDLQSPWNPAGPAPAAHPPMTLVHLRSLKLFKAGMMFDGLGLLAFLTLPSLEELHFALDANNLADFLPFLSRSSCILTRLRVSLALDEPQLAERLAALPHLVEFTAKFDLGSLPLRLLATSLNLTQGCLPHLTALRIIALGTEQNVAYPALIDVLQSRSDDDEGSARLEVFELKFRGREVGPPELVDVARLEALEKQGICVSVKLASGVQLP
ncbi:hypothetical protein DFH09DRAFT_1269122 [Mycena vulgaris]|nr:hypothetical protein DFH09DRAFT_1269122 [Mycena vulgaris]